MQRPSVVAQRATTTVHQYTGDKRHAHTLRESFLDLRHHTVCNRVQSSYACDSENKSLTLTLSDRLQSLQFSFAYVLCSAAVYM
jgi:hypothetical protein